MSDQVRQIRLLLIFENSGWTADCFRIGRDVFIYHRSRACYGLFSNINGCDKHGITANKRVVTDYGKVFFFAVIVTGYSSCPYINLTSDSGISQITVMPLSTVLTYVAVFNFGNFSRGHKIHRPSFNVLVIILRVLVFCARC